MRSKVAISNTKQELPSHFADRQGMIYSSSVSQQHKKKNGQFFTPIEIAELMASFCDFEGKSVRILDPGCGTVILSCALIEKLVKSNKALNLIELVVYETDKELIPIAELSLGYLKEWCTDRGVEVKTIIHKEDFILHNADSFKEQIDLFYKPVEQFDIVVSNPPYFKLPIEDLRVKVGKVVVNGHPNIYALFMALSAKLLKEDGELIFITPRSYAAGGYFKAFRTYFFNLIDLDNVHLFVSRKDTFSRDKVLQETVIIKGAKRTNPKPQVRISSSSGLKDLNETLVKVFPKKDIIDLSSNEKILYLPTTDYEEAVLEVFKNWSGSLAKYNIKVSTGPVVAFRAREYLRANHDKQLDSLAPLFWLHNVKQMELTWPVPKPQKQQYINIETKSIHLLLPNKDYVLLRRFSSKDDKNRLIAAPYFSNFIQSDFIGVENKVNYFYRPNGYLKRNEVIGLCALLNSSLFDTYFRIFNGNVNVSATELRGISLPPLEIIKEIGDTIILSNEFSVEHTNQIISEYFEPAYST